MIDCFRVLVEPTPLLASLGMTGIHVMSLFFCCRNFKTWENILIYFEINRVSAGPNGGVSESFIWQNLAQIKPRVWVFLLRCCASKTQRSVKQDRGVMSHIKWPVMTTFPPSLYFSTSLLSLVFLILFSFSFFPALSPIVLQHRRRFRWTPRRSPAQSKVKDQYG